MTETDFNESIKRLIMNNHIINDRSNKLLKLNSLKNGCCFSCYSINYSEKKDTIFLLLITLTLLAGDIILLCNKCFTYFQNDIDLKM